MVIAQKDDCYLSVSLGSLSFLCYRALEAVVTAIPNEQQSVGCYPTEAGPHDPPAASRELVQELLDLLLGIESPYRRDAQRDSMRN